MTDQPIKPMTTKQQAAALGRAIRRLESEASTFALECDFARSKGHHQHASFFARMEDEAREDAAILTDMIENLPNK